jgi:hypothetical protein
MLYLTSWSKHHALMRKGIPETRSGRAFTIMAKPRKVFGEIGDGFCSALVPRGPEVELMQELVRLRRLDVEDPDLLQKYRHLMTDRIKREGRIAPGVLRAGDVLVSDGDTLCCACAAPDALAGKCHRHWCARLLVEAGWDVEQDGRRILKEFLV